MSKQTDTTEKGLEGHIAQFLVEENKYLLRENKSYNNVSCIEAETAKLNQTISTIEKEIALVEEYKTALIAEAVTGKIDVRDFEIPERVEEENYEELEEELSIAAEDEAEYETKDIE